MKKKVDVWNFLKMTFIDLETRLIWNVLESLGLVCHLDILVVSKHQSL